MYACMQLSWHQCQLKIVLLWLYMWSRPCTRTAPEFLSGLDTKNRCVHTQISPCTFREHRTRVLCLDTKCEHSQRFNLFSQSNSAADPGEGPRGPGPPFCQTKLRPKGPKKMFWRLPPYISQGLDALPPLPYLKVWMRQWNWPGRNDVVALRRYFPSCFINNTCLFGSNSWLHVTDTGYGCKSVRDGQIATVRQIALATHFNTKIIRNR